MGIWDGCMAVAVTTLGPVPKAKKTQRLDLGKLLCADWLEGGSTSTDDKSPDKLGKVP